MAIIQTVDQSTFTAAFKRYDRVGHNRNFSYSGLDVLFDYLEGLSEDTGVNIELDVIGLCCEYEEVLISDFAAQYADCDLLDYEGEPLTDEEEIKEKIQDYLENETSFIGFTGDSVVFASF